MSRGGFTGAAAEQKDTKGMTGKKKEKRIESKGRVKKDESE